MAATVTIQTTETARDLLAAFAASDGLSVSQVVEDLARREADRRRLCAYTEGLAALTPEQLAAYREEQHAWEEASLGYPVAVLTRPPARRSGFGSIPEFAAWTPELMRELDEEILRDIDASEGSPGDDGAGRSGS